VNRGWKEGSTVVFHFLPSHESEARMYISGLIAYLRATTLDWYLDLFKPIARSCSQGMSWDPNTKQITSIIDSNFTETLQQDPHYDLTDSTAGLLSSFTTTSLVADKPVTFEIPSSDGVSLGFFKDTDSISTFRSTARSALKKKGKNLINTSATTTPTQSVSFGPISYDSRPDDTSVSRLSDTASKVACLETRFEQMESQFCSSFARLEAMLSGIGTQRLAANPSSTGSITKPGNSLANHPSQAIVGSSTHSAAGSGS
jgi:hypothetical protein